jgi:hypothetical protein
MSVKLICSRCGAERDALIYCKGCWCLVCHDCVDASRKCIKCRR